MMDFFLMRSLVKFAITNAPLSAWSVQGMGCLRFYPDEAHRYRVHIWDSKLQVPNVSMVHDHPWDLRSTVLSGQLCNVRYMKPITDRWKPYRWALIKCGEGGGIESEWADIHLEACQTEVYGPGGHYVQQANEIHETGYVDGTVTVIERVVPEGNDPNQARVFWPAGTEWVSAEPRPATEEEVRKVGGNALFWWDNHG